MVDFNKEIVGSAVSDADVAQYQDTLNTQAAQEPNTTPAHFGTPDQLAMESISRAATYGLPGLAVGLVDTLGQSVGLLNDNTVSDTLKQTFGPGGFGDWYARNQKPLRTGADIVGMFIPYTLGLKVLKSARIAREAFVAGEEGSAAFRSFADSGAVRALLGSSTRLSELQSAVSAAATDAGSQIGVFTGRTLASAELTASKVALYKGQALESIRQASIFNAGAALFNSDPVLFPQDATSSDYVKWGAETTGIQVGVDFLAARFAAGRLVRRAWNAIEPLSGMTAEIPKTLFRPGQRGPGLAVYSAARNDILVESNAAPSAAATLRSNLSTDTTLIDTIRKDNLVAMAEDKYPIPFVKSANLELSQHAVLNGLLDSNPTALVTAKKLSDLPASKNRFFTDIRGAKDALQEKFQAEVAKLGEFPDPDAVDAIHAKYAPLNSALNDTRIVLEGDGALSLYGTRADNWLDHNSLSSISASNITEKQMVAGREIKVPKTVWAADSVNGKPISINNDFEIKMPGNMQPLDHSALQAVVSKAVQDWKPAKTQADIVLSPDRPWQELAAIATAAEKNSQLEHFVKLGAGFNDMNDVIFHIVNERYKEWSDLVPNIAHVDPSVVAPTKMARFMRTPAQALQQVMIPQGLFEQTSPLTEFFVGAHAGGVKDLREIFPQATTNTLGMGKENPVGLLQASLRETVGETNPKVTYPLLDNSFQQTGVKPVLIHASAIPDLTRSDAVITALADGVRQEVLQKLASVTPEQAPLINTVMSTVGGMPVIDQARHVENLFANEVHGLGILTAQDRVNENSPTLKAMAMVAQTLDRATEIHIAQRLAPLDPFSAHLLNKNNTADLLDLTRINHAYRHGFVVDHAEYDAATGTAKYVLDQEDPRNRIALARYFGNGAVPSQEDESLLYLPDMSLSARKRGAATGNIEPLVVSEKAAKSADMISEFEIQQGAENNVLRTLAGKSPITLRKWHLPTPELYQEGTWFVQNSVGKNVATYTSRTVGQNEARAKEAATQLSTVTGEKHIALAAETVQQNAILDDTYFELVDYSDQLRKSAPAYGGLVRTEIDSGPETFKAMLKSLNRQYANVALRARALLFEPQLNYARQAAAVTAGGVVTQATKETNIFNRYLATAFSQPTRATAGITAQAYGKLENVVDAALNITNVAWLQGRDAAKASKLEAMVKGSMTDPKNYKTYQEAAESWSPFKNAVDWMESTYQERPPAKLRSMVGFASKLSNTMAIRFADPGMALLNIFGTLPVLPTVVAAMRQRPGELAAEYANRVGLWGVQHAEGVTTFSAMKAMIKGSRDFFNGKLKTALEEAVRVGDLSPEYHTLDAAMAAGTGGKGKFEKFVDGASWLTDHSETWSRRFAWGVGYSMAKDLFKVEDNRNAMLFAQNMVNEVIGNYSAQNKPGMFQGALGVPLGAFQTYMFNYYRRLFGYIENKDMRALAVQYALQTSLFGAAGTPGWNVFTNHIVANETTSDTLESRLDRNLPPLASELLLHGTFSSIPRLVGVDPMAFYTRGSVDMNQLPPTPLTYASDPSRGAPIANLINIAGAMKDTMTNVLQGFSVQQQEELLAHYSMNRSFKRVMEMAANATVDARGQVIESGIRDAAHIAAGLMGTVPAQTRILQDAYYKQRTVEVLQTSLRNDLNMRTRAMIRGGNFDLSDLQGAAAAYLRSGGNPAYFGSWLRNNAVIATQSRTDLKLKALLSRPDGIEFANMLAAMQHDPDAADQQQEQDQSNGQQ